MLLCTASILSPSDARKSCRSLSCAQFLWGVLSTRGRKIEIKDLKFSTIIIKSNLSSRILFSISLPQRSKGQHFEIMSRQEISRQETNDPTLVPTTTTSAALETGLQANAATRSLICVILVMADFEEAENYKLPSRSSYQFRLFGALSKMIVVARNQTC